MKTTPDFLDAIRKNQHLPSDYAAAQRLGISRQAVSKWRNGQAHVSPELATRVAELAGLDETEVLLAAQIERSTTPGERAIWERLLKRLGSAAGCYVIGGAIVAGLAFGPAPSRASAPDFSGPASIQVTDYTNIRRRRSGRRRAGFRPTLNRFVTDCKTRRVPGFLHGSRGCCRANLRAL